MQKACFGLYKPSRLSKIKSGDYLLSHTASRAVPSAPKSLTSEFEVGSGMASSILPPEIFGRPRQRFDAVLRCLHDSTLPRESLTARVR